MHFGQNKGKFKVKENITRDKVALGLLHHRLGHRYTRSLMAGDSEFVLNDIELGVYSDPFFTSCQISSMNKKAGSKIH